MKFLRIDWSVPFDDLVIPELEVPFVPILNGTNRPVRRAGGLSTGTAYLYKDGDIDGIWGSVVREYEEGGGTGAY